MLASLTRNATVTLAASLVLLSAAAPLAAAADPSLPPTTEATVQPAEVPGPAETSPPGTPATQEPPNADVPAVTAGTVESPSPAQSGAPTGEPSTTVPDPESEPVPAVSPPVHARLAALAPELEVCEGVWVAVQPSTDQQPSLDCVALSQAPTALDALSSLRTVSAPGGFINQIDDFPEDPTWDEANPVFWAFCTATADPASGDLTWTSSMVGAGQLEPAAGTVVGFRFGLWNDDPAVMCPAVSWVPVQSTSPTPSPEPSRDPASGSAKAAADWIKKNQPAAGDPDGQWQAILGLASVDQCRYAPAVERQLALLKKEAASYTANNPGRAGRLAIVAAAVGEDPYDFGGVDLIQVIVDGTRADGQVEPGANPFSQALAIIGLARAGEPVPDEMITALLGMQNSTGAFGFGSGDSFWPDLDGTGLAIQALGAFVSPATSAAIDAAVAWVMPQQEASGMWPNEWGSPVNTTGVVGSSLELVGKSSGDALTWLKSQQLADGGFPPSLGGDESNLFATTEALFLLTGTSYLTVELDLYGACADTDNGTDGGEGPKELTRTGATDATGLLGITAVVLVAAGGALVGLRRSRQS